MEGEGVPVETLMSTEIVTVSPEASLEEAANDLLDEGIASLLVTDEDGELTGILTNTDFVGMIADGESGAEATVGDYMSTDVITASPGEPITDAAARMITNNIHHLPVVTPEDDLAGMLSTTDLATHLSYS